MHAKQCGQLTHTNHGTTAFCYAKENDTRTWEWHSNPQSTNTLTQKTLFIICKCIYISDIGYQIKLVWKVLQNSLGYKG